MTKLENRTAIITGSSRGVGRAVALALAAEGCDVVLAAKTVEPHPTLPGTIHTVAAEVEALGRRALPVKTDVRDPEQIGSMVEQAVAAFGRVDILINNAGAAWWYGIEETPPKRFDLVMDVNCKGPFFACQAVLPHMKSAGWGHIVNMSPPIVPKMAKGKIAYMISKFGMTLVSQGLAGELEGTGVAVNSLWPVTLVESLATINLGLGAAKDWRKADILADATVAVVTTPPAARTGQALLDEDVLREAGVTDFDRYACVPGTTPMRIPW
jgi:citronellol/citronellal dehydrogenase